MGYAALTGIAGPRVIDSLSAVHENNSRLDNPIRMLKPAQDLLTTVSKLKAQGYNLFYVGDGSHFSFAAPRTSYALVDSTNVAITDFFVEYPENQKTDPNLMDALGEVSYQKNTSPGQVEAKKLSDLLKKKREQGVCVNIHDTDTELGPDCKNAISLVKAASTNPLHQMPALGKFLWKGREILEGMNRDILFRNQNMATVIAHHFLEQQKQKADFCGLFEVGQGHLEGEMSVPELIEQAKIPGLKAATIETLPVKAKSLDKKVWECAGQKGHFVITYDDPDNGIELLANNTVQNQGAWYQFPKILKTAELAPHNR